MGKDKIENYLAAALICAVVQMFTVKYPLISLIAGTLVMIFAGQAMREIRYHKARSEQMLREMNDLLHPEGEDADTLR